MSHNPHNESYMSATVVTSSGPRHTEDADDEEDSSASASRGNLRLLGASSRTMTRHHVTSNQPLSWDNITEILMLTDMNTALQLANCVTMTPSKAFSHVWKALLQRQRFPVIMVEHPVDQQDAGRVSTHTEGIKNSIDYLQELLYRRSLFSTIIGTRRQTRSISYNCLSLPIKSYSFVSIRPDDSNHPMQEEEEDPPPVDFHYSGDPCLLLHPTKGECVLYNPFTGQLTYCASILEQSLQSSDFVHTTTKGGGERRIISSQENQVSSSRAGNSVVLCENLNTVASSEDGDEVLFPHVNRNHGDDDERPLCDVIPLGMAMSYGRNRTSLQVAFGRSIHLITHEEEEHDDNPSINAENKVVTEVRAWERPILDSSSSCRSSEGRWKEQGMVRFRHGFFALEWDGTYQLFYVNLESDTPDHTRGSNKILVYPLDSLEKEGDTGKDSYDGDVEMQNDKHEFHDEDEVQEDYLYEYHYHYHYDGGGYAYDYDYAYASGRRLSNENLTGNGPPNRSNHEGIGTNGNNVDPRNDTRPNDDNHRPVNGNINNSSGQRNSPLPFPIHHPDSNNACTWIPSNTFPSPLITIDCGEAVTSMACLQDILVVGIASCQLQIYHQWQLVNTLDVAKCARKALSPRKDAIPFQVAPITEFQVPTHLEALETFVTMHHDDTSGTKLLLWTLDSTMKDHTYQVESIVQLPLIPHRRPCLYYDGRRLIAYGQDHIGYIVLVYVAGTGDDDPAWGLHNYPNDGSGGVLVSSSSCPSSTLHGLRFVRRIRHAALGGHLNYERLVLYCNERFLVLNTKLGHSLVDGGGTDGLLVIDLEQAD